MIWKVEAEGDTVYVEAVDIDQAETKFQKYFGKIPKRMMKWTLVDKIPEGEETIG